MKNRKVRIDPVAALRDCRQIDSKHPPGCRVGCRIFEQKATKETKRESRSKIGTSLSSFPSVQNPSQSSLIKPNQAISCFDAIQSQPPSCSKISTSSFLLRLLRRSEAKSGQTPSMPVKASQSDSRSLPSGHSSSRRHLALWSPQPNAQPMVVCLCGGRHRGQKSAIRNPQSAIPVDSTQFHLIPPNSTPSPANGRFQPRPQPSRSLHFNPPPPTV
jgi:hypothetical protein